MSIEQLCDSGCTATFANKSAVITREGKTVITGHRNPTTKLWELHPSSQASGPSIPTINTALGCPSAAARVRFYHAALFSPSLSTLQHAIDAGYLHSIPGLTSTSLRRHPPISEATIKGHLNAQRKNVRSTKRTYSTPHYIFSASASPPTRTHAIYADCITATGCIYTDQSGPFLTPSTSGNKYIFVMYDIDSNFIDAIPIPSRTKEQLVKAYRTGITRLQQRGLTSQLHRLDSEISKLMEEEIKSNNINYQLTPSGNHSRNAAERAIQTFKNHFVADLSSVHPSFPLRLWDELIPQAVISLNLLRPSRVNPYLYGSYDYSAHPFTPPGKRVLIHNLPAQRKSWDPHTTERYYLLSMLQSLEHFLRGRTRSSNRSMDAPQCNLHPDPHPR